MMSRPGLLNALLFWLMLLLGAAVLMPCLVLPVWLERQAQADCLQAHQEYIAQLERRLLTAQKQIEHLNKDPAYILRLAERDFGDSLMVPGAETVRVATSPSADERDDDDAQGAGANGGLPDMAEFVENAIQRHPQTRLFVHPHSRPIIMAMGGALILCAIVLVAFGGRGAVGRDAAGAGTDGRP